MRVNAKLALGATVIAATIGYLGYLGASGSWQYYVLVDECVVQADQLCSKRLRVSGSVAVGSLDIAVDRHAASFLLEGNKHRLRVNCRGTIPDNLVEGMEIVVEGRLQSDGHLQGEKVITRCASKYAPKESPSGEKVSQVRPPS